MSSKTYGTPYEVLERLGKYQPSQTCFKKGSVAYCCVSDNTANVSEDAVIIEKDYGKSTKITIKMQR